MDKKNLTIGIVLLIAAFVMISLGGPRSAPPTQPSNAQTATTPGATTPASAPAASGPTAAAPGAAATAPTTPAAPALVPGVVNREPETARTVELKNEFITAEFSDYGGALRSVALKKYHAVQGEPAPYVFNQTHENAILALTEVPGAGREARYEVETASPTEIVFKRTILDGKVEVRRRYTLTKEGEPGADPYRIHHETTFKNLSGETLPLGHTALNLGTAALMNAGDDGQFLSVASYNGSDSHYIDPSDLSGGMFSSEKAELPQGGPIKWAAVKNQFFTSIYTAATPGSGLVVRRVNLPPFANSARPNVGITAAARFDLPALAPAGQPKASATLAGLAFVGPLEYSRIKNFDDREDRVFPYYRGFNKFFLSGFVSPFQNLLLNTTHKWTGNWGVAIILMTILLKLISLPFTIKASKSAKQMAKLQPLMQEIREKHKDNPQKQQMATMELFKTHKVNPLGGCIPILITFPLFIGFFAMLQGTAELRFQSFLWAKDLAAPDTIAHLWGFPINIMPLLMGATMIVQMRLTPTPSVDNMQMKMMQFMPVIFTIFCYNFSCALSLYSTINGLFTIGQQMVINRMKDDDAGPVGPGAAAAATAAAWGKKKPMKNVTPPKKK